MAEPIYYCDQTNAGLSLLAKITATCGRPDFHRAEIGSGAPGDSTDIPALRSLLNKRNDLSVKKSFIGDTNTIKFGVVLDSSQVTEGYEVKEIGLYLRDDMTGKEALFSYMYFENGDFMPPGYLIRKTFEYTIDTAISSSSNVEIITNDSVYITVKDLDDLMARILRLETILLAYENAEKENAEKLARLNEFKKQVAQIQSRMQSGLFVDVAENSYLDGNTIQRMQSGILDDFIIHQEQEYSAEAWILSRLQSGIADDYNTSSLQVGGTDTGLIPTPVASEAEKISYQSPLYPEVTTVQQGLDITLTAVKEISWD